MHRGIRLGLPGVALATAGGLYAEVRRAVNAPLPRFDDLDPSGRYAAPQERSGPPVRIGVLGDSSITAPGLADPTRSWIAQLAARLPYEVHLDSHARGGSRVRDVLEDQVPAAVAGRPDVFVISVGANDAIHCTPSRQYGRALCELLDQLRATAPVVALGIGDLSVIPRAPLSLRPFLAHRSTVIDRAHAAATARRHDVVRVPVSELSDPHFRVGGRDLFAGDLFHPNERGHRLWAELFEPFVHAALQQRVAQRDAQPAAQSGRSGSTLPSPAFSGTSVVPSGGQWKPSASSFSPPISG